MEKAAITTAIKLSDGSDLYFHTEAADQISDLLKHNKYHRKKFAEIFFNALHEGQITAYSHIDGAEMQTPIPFQKPLCVKVQDVMAWLERNNYPAQWCPDEFDHLSLYDPRANEQAGTATGPNYKLLATRSQLIDAFGRFTGMDNSWFKKLGDTPALLAARKIKGIGRNRNSIEPWFCPKEVMGWLISPKRRKGRPLSLDKGWELLEKYFPHVHNMVSLADPRDKP